VASARMSDLSLFRVLGDEGWKCPAEGHGDPFQIVTEVKSLPFNVVNKYVSPIYCT